MNRIISLEIKYIQFFLKKTYIEKRLAKPMAYNSMLNDEIEKKSIKEKKKLKSTHANMLNL
jgi:hypothetical protein